MRSPAPQLESSPCWQQLEKALAKSSEDAAQLKKKQTRNNGEMSNTHKNQLEWTLSDEVGKILIAVTN